MNPKYYYNHQLRWESTENQWWYATPIDVAASNGYYHLVLELLRLDPNLLLKLSSLRRLRRLESFWYDPSAAAGRAKVARQLLLYCDGQRRKKKKKENPLIRAGYGGWILYSAAAAGDVEFVKDLLERDPLLVFGQGEYGLSDLLYAGARSHSCAVFRVLLDSAISALEEGHNGNYIEVMNRAVHAAGRAGNLEVLQGLFGDFGFDCGDVLGFRDALGSTVLHSASASATGQLEVVQFLIASYDNMVHSRDNQGNTPLHVAAYKGHFSIVEALLFASPSLASLTNHQGNTFLHMAILGFCAPGFHRLDLRLDLMTRLLIGNTVSLENIINVRNDDGRTALHLAVFEQSQTGLVELLIKVPGINVNVVDLDGLTPLDHLKRGPETVGRRVLIKRLGSMGAIANGQDQVAGNGRVRVQLGVGNSPGTSFRTPDSEIFLLTDKNNDDNDSASEDACRSESSELSSCASQQCGSDSSKGHLRILLKWPKRKGKSRRKNTKMEGNEDADSVKLFKVCKSSDDIPTPLRQRFTRNSSSLPDKRAVSLKWEFPSPSAKERFTASLMKGVIQATPASVHLAYYSPSSQFCNSMGSSPTSMDRRHKSARFGSDSMMKSAAHRRQSSLSKLGVMNQYVCFGAQGLVVEDSVGCRQPRRACRSLVF